MTWPFTLLQNDNITISWGLFQGDSTKVSWLGIMCLDKSEDINTNRFKDKLKGYFATYVFSNYFEKAEYLPDGICKSCNTILYSQARPGQQKNIKYNIDYDLLAKHVHFLTKKHSEAGENGQCPCELCKIGRRKGYDKKITRFSPNLLSPYISGPRTEQSRYNFYYLFTFAIQSNNMMIGVKIIEFIYFLKIEIT